MTSPCLTASLSNVERGRGEVSPEIRVGRQPRPGPSRIEKLCQGNINQATGIILSAYAEYHPDLSGWMNAIEKMLRRMSPTT